MDQRGRPHLIALSPFHLFTLAALHAVLFALAFPPFDVWFLAFVAPAPLGVLAISAARGRALLAVYVTQFFMWLWLVRWIIPVTAVGYPFLALYMSIWPTLFVWVLGRAARHSVLGRWPMTVLLPIVWTGIEFFRGDVLFYGYPWYLLGHPLIAVPAFVQSADLLGTYFITFLAAALSGAFLDLSRLRLRARNAPAKSPIVLAILLLANLVYGAWRLNESVPLRAGPTVLAIQTNLPQDNKTGWSHEEQEKDLPGFMNLTRDAIAAAASPPDLIIWPETMVPGIGFEPQTMAKIREMLEQHGWDLMHLLRWPAAVVEFQRQLGIPMIVGSEAWIDTADVQDGNRIRLEPKFTFNSAYLIEGEPPYQRYDKYFLTPFGETMPYISAWPWLERQFLTIGVGADLAFNLDSNPDVKLLRVRDGQDGAADDEVRIAAPICFEDTVARFCRSMIYREGEKSGDLFVNISNDGWFGLSKADRKLHAQIARFRCIENRVPMVRSVNTGMTIWIDSTGNIKNAAGGTGYGQAQATGWVIADVELDSRVSLYGRIGELWPTLCLISTAVLLGWSLFSPGRRYTAG